MSLGLAVLFYSSLVCRLWFWIRARRKTRQRWPYTRSVGANCYAAWTAFEPDCFSFFGPSFLLLPSAGNFLQGVYYKREKNEQRSKPTL